MTGDEQLDYALIWFFVIVCTVAMKEVFSGGRKGD